MSTNNDNDNRLLRKDLKPHGFKRRSRAPKIRIPNGSNSAFQVFYQNGGRDYEQYRLWLQTLSKSKQPSIPSDVSDKIKIEPLETTLEIINISPPSIPSRPLALRMQPSLSTLRDARTHPFLKPIRHVSLPYPPVPSSLLTTTSIEPQVHLPCDCSHISTVPVLSSLVTNWSIGDVGRYFEKHFPDKTIARKFVHQKIDGRTLPLLTEEHLTKVFKMKLGPALHLLAMISDLQIQNQIN